MKTILKTLLLVAVLCLAGCSGDDPQSVAFADETLESPSFGWTYNLNIEANCLWSISTETSGIRIESSSGEGSSTVVLHLMENKTYDDSTHRITITSEDGTSSDILTIVQKAMTGIEVGKTDMISEEGGTFTIPVKTNDEITSVDTPDWITFTSSRALTSYTYEFTAEPNRTGAVRSGTVTLKGKELSKNIEVTQDSYTPTDVEIPELLASSFILEEAKYEDVSITVKATPEYADASKLSVSIEPRYRTNYTYENGIILLKHTNQGPHRELTITFSYKGKVVAVKKTRIVDGKISFYNYGGRTDRFYVGEEFSFQPTIEESLIETSVSDNSGISILSPTSFRAEKEGTYDITFTNKVSGKQTTKHISVKKCIAEAYMSYCYDWGSMWDVQITGEFMANNITEYTTAFIDGNRNLQAPLNKDSGTSSGTSYLVNKYSFSIIAYDRADLEYKIGNFKFVFNGKIDGEDYSCTIPVSPEKP